MDSYTGFAEFYDLFMDNIPYEEWSNYLISLLKEYNVNFDEGPIDDEGNSNGNYGPYIQSEREDIYKAFVKHLIEQGLAYPCFCTPEELDEIRQKQQNRTIFKEKRFGVYWKNTVWSESSKRPGVG